MFGRIGGMLSGPLMAIFMLYMLAWAVVAVLGLVDAWGVIGGLFGAFVAIPLPYGAYRFAIDNMDLPMWGAILFAIPPNILLGAIAVIWEQALDR